MSARYRNKPPDLQGRYMTPLAVAGQCVDEILPIVSPFAPQRILEPAAGHGSFVWHLARAYPLAQITAIDIKPDRTIDLAPITIKIAKGNFLDERFEPDVDLIIGNPPYQLALDFCAKAIRLAPVVVFLVRLGFLASIKRHAFWAEHKPHRVFILSRRPSFSVGGGTDSTDYCFVCWQAGASGTHLHWLPPHPADREVFDGEGRAH